MNQINCPKCGHGETQASMTISNKRVTVKVECGNCGELREFQPTDADLESMGHTVVHKPAPQPLRAPDYTLKLWPSYFQAKLDGLKPWEHRNTWDRDFKVGDMVTFQEWDPNANHRVGAFTGREIGPVEIVYLHESDGAHCIFTHTMPDEK